MNDMGHFYPLWGTCLGFENMAIWASDEGSDVLTILEAHNVNLPLEFIGEADNNRMFGDLGVEAYGFEDLAIALNSHTFGVSPDKFKTDAGLSTIFHPTSVSYTTDDSHLPFVASMESS